MAGCSGESGVVPIMRSSRASGWRIMPCEVHVVSIMQSSGGTYFGAERCAGPLFRVLCSIRFDSVGQQDADTAELTQEVLGEVCRAIRSFASTNSEPGFRAKMLGLARTINAASVSISCE